MGLFSKIFGGRKSSNVKSFATKQSFLRSYRVAGGKSYYGGGWGLARFNDVVNAHSSVDDLVEEFTIYDEGCNYMSLDGYPNCYTQAYQEEYEKASAEAAVMNMFGMDVDPEELMDFEAVEENAYNYSCDLVNAWLDGSDWIPEEVMDFAWYELSSHNV